MMKRELTTVKIFKGMLMVIWVTFMAALLFSGEVGTFGAVMAAPLIFPVISSKEISDTDSLAGELNKVFSTFAANVQKAITDEFAAKGSVSLKDLDEKLKALGIEGDTVKTINDVLRNHALEFEKAASGSRKEVGFKEMIKSAFSREGLAADIKKMYDNRSGILDVTKVVGNVTTANVTTTSGGIALLDMLNADEVRDIILQTPFIEEFANVSSTNQAVYTYVDYVPGEGDMTYLSEGGTKQQLDLDVTVKTVTPVKVAGYEILTEEAVTDIPRMESNARNLLFKRYLLKRQNGILFGTGQNNEPSGVTTIAAAFNPASWVGAKVDTPNLHDVIIALANQIYTTFSYTDDVEYYPNVAFVNPADFAALRTAKEGNGAYLFPSFTLYGGSTIDGIRVIPKSKIPSGYILMGDFTKLNIIDYIAYSVRIGWINDQFIKNLFTMLGEGRFYTYVKTLDQRAFVYDQITTVIAGITAEVN